MESVGKIYVLENEKVSDLERELFLGGYYTLSTPIKQADWRFLNIGSQGADREVTTKGNVFPRGYPHNGQVVVASYDEGLTKFLEGLKL
ncbi:MAG: hypothetical protein WCI72_02755 [archaeon]